ncbi:MAG: deoxyribodipyrimidine photolyase [Candidatus Eiseniibacteriota bacterium]|jgi:deoxyribodipyrimidine photo-lyase
MTPGNSRSVPAARLHTGNDRPVRADGDYVLYWMIAQRRVGWNFGLERAVALALELGRPLVVFEALGAGYRWASDRLHRFVIEGMADNAAALRDRPVLYYPYLEPTPGAGRGLLRALGAQACVVVTDDFPTFIQPRMIAAAGAQLPVRLEAVDGNGLWPMRATDRTFLTAFSFRRHLQRELPAHLGTMPLADPLARARLRRPGRLPAAITRRWPAIDGRRIGNARGLAAELPIDHAVGAGALHGGTRAGQTVLERFVRERLDDYADARNHPDVAATSELSPYLHFGHVSAHEIFVRVMKAVGWKPERLGRRATGARSGWWRAGDNAEAFLDQLVTWRELGFNMCVTRDDHDRYASLPDWARETLAAHAGDPRPHRYALETFASARTHDRLWNAAQRQLVRDGVMHNYLRMVWGKKILEWCATPEEALDVMIELNNRYALDGRDPNSYSGIFWCLGRYDRPWGPERPIFGKIRYMSTRNTARKLRLDRYLEEYAE